MDIRVQESIRPSVMAALAEDVGSGDISAQLFIDTKIAKAQVITREAAVFCGKSWADAAFELVDPMTKLHWYVKDGDQVVANQLLFEVEGDIKSLLTAERTALNFLQLLSGTATSTYQYVREIAHTSTKLLDTRKTIVGLRLAQKYAVSCGGGVNHRFGLYDKFLIKENHIIAAGSISKAVEMAKNLSLNCEIEVEIERLDQLEEAISSGVDCIMLDNFNLEQCLVAVISNNKRVKLEASGGIDLSNIVSIAETGVDYISVGAITKNLSAIDLSMRFI